MNFILIVANINIQNLTWHVITFNKQRKFLAGGFLQLKVCMQGMKHFYFFTHINTKMKCSVTTLNLTETLYVKISLSCPDGGHNNWGDGK